MTNINDNTVYAPNVMEFVTVAFEYCSFLESAKSMSTGKFVDRASKLLPLVYIKAALLPDVERVYDSNLELYVTEDMYEGIRSNVAEIMGERDVFLETFHPDMPFSDTPVAAFISECLSDVYQDLGNFCHVYRQGYEETMLEAVATVRENFGTFWGQALLNSLKALHAVRYSLDDEEMMRI